MQITYGNSVICSLHTEILRYTDYRKFANHIQKICDMQIVYRNSMTCKEFCDMQIAYRNSITIKQFCDVQIAYRYVDCIQKFCDIQIAS